MRKFLVSLKSFLKSKEARSFWVAIGFIFLLIILSLFTAEGVLRYINIALLLLVGGILFINSFKKIKSSTNLSLEQSLLDSIVKYLDDAVITYDQNFKILNFNKSAETLFQLKEVEIVGQNFSLQESSKNPKFSLLRQVIFPSLAPSIKKISKPGAYPQVVHLSFETPYLELQSITIPIQPDKGKPKAFVKIITDQTRQIAIVKSKNEFVTVASHQLRTPISAINWAFQELSKSNLSEKDRQEIFESGSKAAQKLSNIIKDFLNVAKIEEGRFGYNFEKIKVLPFIEDVVSQAAIVAKQHGINLYFEKPKQDYEITADKSKLGMVLSNLLENAIKYNVENGQVIVRVQKQQNKPFLQISVEDTGVGVKADEIDRLFSKFYRSESVTKKDTTGTGLGLYIAKNIIRQHGGQIWLESVFGRGSTFHFTLPTDPSLIPQREVGNFGAE